MARTTLWQCLGSGSRPAHLHRTGPSDKQREPPTISPYSENQQPDSTHLSLSSLRWSVCDLRSLGYSDAGKRRYQRNYGSTGFLPAPSTTWWLSSYDPLPSPESICTVSVQSNSGGEWRSIRNRYESPHARSRGAAAMSGREPGTGRWPDVKKQPARSY